MQRIVFVNLHANPFLLRHLNGIIWKQSCALKHKYFLDFLLSNPDIEVCNYINKEGFTIIRSFPKLIQFLLDKLALLENRIVLRKNNIPVKSIKVITKIEDILPYDIVIGYSSVPSSIVDMDKIHSFKAISTIHFYGHQSESDMLRNANPNVLFNECDLKKHSEIFRRYYDWYNGDFIVHSFVAAPRFLQKKAFDTRENKCFSTGTITYRLHPEHLAVYGDPCDQPTRKQIKDNKKQLDSFVACYNSDFTEDTQLKSYRPEDNFFVHYYKVWYNASHCTQQKKYFSFNMVDKFNDYEMCMIGEEIIGVPGIGFVEGMSCGCAYIGQTLGYYEDYGMKEGAHYIGYDGTLEDLKAKISYYQQPEHQKELEQIANEGYEFAQTHFRGDVVAKELLDKLMTAQTEWKKQHS